MVNKMFVVKDNKKIPYWLNKVFNISFGVNRSPTFPFCNRYMSSNNTIEYTYKKQY